jgi:AraC-like DNA-binding protein
MSTQLFYLVSFLGAIQGSLVSLIMWFKKVNRANTFFTLFLLLYSVGLLEPYLTTLLNEQNVVTKFLSFSNFLYGPLIYLYIVHLYKRLPNKQLFIHFLPFLIGLVAGSVSEIVGMSLQQNDRMELFFFEILMIQMPGYTLAALKALKTHQSVILKQQTTFNEADINWLKYFLVMLLTIYILSFAITNLSLFGFTRLNSLHRVNQLFMMSSIYIVAYKILLKPEFLLPRNIQFRETKEQPVRYSRSGLSEEKAFEYLQLVLNYMSDNKPFLDPSLSVHELAARVGISKNHLTQVLNEKLDKNFYEFVNDYRIGEAKQLISDQNYEHLNLSALGLKSGFRSKSGFNTNFKKATGLTPSEWKKKMIVN